jgi:hypothetical protein
VRHGEPNADRRVWLLVLALDRLRAATAPVRSLDEAIVCIRIAERRPSPAWSLAEPELRDVLRRLLAHGWIEETPDGWRVTVDGERCGVDDAVRVLSEGKRITNVIAGAASRDGGDFRRGQRWLAAGLVEGREDGENRGLV